MIYNRDITKFNWFQRLILSLMELLSWTTNDERIP